MDYFFLAFVTIYSVPSFARIGSNVSKVYDWEWEKVIDFKIESRMFLIGGYFLHKTVESHLICLHWNHSNILISLNTILERRRVLAGDYKIFAYIGGKNEFKNYMSDTISKFISEFSCNFKTILPLFCESSASFYFYWKSLNKYFSTILHCYSIPISSMLIVQKANHKFAVIIFNFRWP